MLPPSPAVWRAAPRDATKPVAVSLVMRPPVAGFARLIPPARPLLLPLEVSRGQSRGGNVTYVKLPCGEEPTDSTARRRGALTSVIRVRSAVASEEATSPEDGGAACTFPTGRQRLPRPAHLHHQDEPSRTARLASDRLDSTPLRSCAIHVRTHFTSPAVDSNESKRTWPQEALSHGFLDRANALVPNGISPRWWVARGPRLPPINQGRVQKDHYASYSGMRTV